MRYALARAGKSGRRVVSAFTATVSPKTMPTPASGQDPFDGRGRRRTKVVGIFPYESAIVHLVAVLLLDQNGAYGSPSRCKGLLGPLARHRHLQSCFRPRSAAARPQALMVFTDRRPGKWTSSWLALFSGLSRPRSDRSRHPLPFAPCKSALPSGAPSGYAAAVRTGPAKPLAGSASPMAEARRLVTDGPYALARHPLYIAEEIAVIGLFLQYASLWAGLLVVAHLL
jgi:hypothetical protein